MMKSVKKIVKSIIKTLLLLFPVRNNKIVFCSFGGKNYGGNPKYIAEEIARKHPNVDMVWILKNPLETIPKGMRKVRANSVRCLYEYRTAKVIVQDIRNSHFCKKRRGQYYLQTWHGARHTKEVEKAAEATLSDNYVAQAKYDGSVTDAFIVDSEQQAQIAKRDFWLNDDVEFLVYGLPRNDIFFDSKKKDKASKKVRKVFKRKDDDYLVLYAPTFRDDGSTDAYVTNFERLLDAFDKKTGKNSIIMVRFHPNVDKRTVGVAYSDRVIDASEYPDMQELAIACDCCISDYSSSIFGFVTMSKPVFLYAPDYDEYSAGRGLSREFLNIPLRFNKSIGELVEEVLAFKKKEYVKKIDKMNRDAQVVDDGHASEKAAEWIMNKIEKGKN